MSTKSNRLIELMKAHFIKTSGKTLIDILLLTLIKSDEQCDVSHILRNGNKK